MKKQDYSKYTSEQLKGLIDNLFKDIVRSYQFTEKNKKFHPQNRKKIRREIARIKTEINKRKVDDRRKSNRN